MIEIGDRVELFAIYPDRWIWRGSGIAEGPIGSGGLIYVSREKAHGIAALTREAIGSTIAVLEIPLDKNCQCHLPCVPVQQSKG